MLNTISWQQYLTAVLLLSVAWYVTIGLRYYRRELAGLFKLKTAGGTDFPPVANKFTVVMGAAKPDSDTGVYASEELRFSAAVSDDISDQTVPAGPGDELLADAKILVGAYTDHGDKTEFLSMLRALLDRYEVLSDEISLPAMIAQLRPFAEERLPFRLESNEWPSTF